MGAESRKEKGGGGENEEEEPLKIGDEMALMQCRLTH